MKILVLLVAALLAILALRLLLLGRWINFGGDVFLRWNEDFR
jgi:hypothetical protein